MNRIRIMKEIKRLAINNEHFYNWYSQLSGLELKYYDLFDEIMNCLEKMNFCFRSELIDFFNPINRTVELYTKCKMAV